jgi:hypothetical protein
MKTNKDNKYKMKYFLIGIIIGILIGLALFYIMFTFRIITPFGFGGFPRGVVG